MRIVLLTHFFGPDHIGGTEVLTESLAKGLQHFGHSVQVICGEDWETAPSFQIDAYDGRFHDIPVRRLHFNWQKAPDAFRYLYNNPQVEEHVYRFLRNQRPDVVHITSCYSLSASVISAAHRLGVPTVLTATDFWFSCARITLLQTDGSLCSGPESAWKCTKCNLANQKIYRWTQKFLPGTVHERLLHVVGKQPWLTNRPGLRGLHGDWDARQIFLRKAFEQVDYTVTASHFLKNYFRKYGALADRIGYSSYGLDTSWATNYQTKTPSAKLRIGFIGQLVPSKGPDILLRALQRLDRHLPIEAKIFGDLTKMPDYGASLRHLALNDPRIHFEGTFDNSQMGQVLSEIDVLVVPSVWYDFPLVIPGAFATKTPVLATNLPGMNEMITNGVDGLLFERSDFVGLADEVLRLVTQPDCLARLRQGIAPVKTSEKMAEEYIALYESVIAGRPPHAIDEIRQVNSGMVNANRN